MSKILNPQVEVEALEKDITPYVAKAQKLVVIENAKDMEKASEMRAQLKAYEKEVTAKKEAITKPMNAALKAVRSMFSPLEDRIEETLNTINRAMIDYQTEQKRISDAEQEKIAQRIGQGKGKLKLETAVEKMKEVDTPDKQVVTASGGTEFIDTPCFEVTDVSLLPKEYILPDLVKIRAAMKGGIELDGVRYWNEQRPRNMR